eukprot:CAMPEP_0194126186 /NCGR_PEP_ID=MMETSP0150-20130528/59857_1 /TAXON_ID=122233 /ORGANISM="Chaetoceros debilis, Strain MM31A-1" /LENGTH=216 /DNA_ID=CAMNT_0038820035 /DNA_START=831 /DNA_END=1481 /DNA_ORIENTATION=-
MKFRFDTVNAENGPQEYLQENSFSFFNMVAVNGANVLEQYPGDALIGFGEAATSEPNFAGPNHIGTYYETDMMVACFGGTFDLKHVTLMPLARFEDSEDGFSTPPPLVATIVGLDINKNLVALQSVTLDITKEGTPTKVRFGKVFENVSTIIFSIDTLNVDEGDTAVYGIDDLKITNWNGPCELNPPEEPEVATSSDSVFEERIKNLRAVKSSSWN